MQRSFRKFGRTDPFEEARRQMRFRLVELQEDILRKFKAGEQREIMRRSMRELIDAQSDLQGKISKLMIFAQQIQLSGLDEQDQDEFADFNRFRRDQPQKEKYQERNFHSQSTQFSRIYRDKERIATEKDYHGFIDKRMSQSSKSIEDESKHKKNPESYIKNQNKNSRYGKERSFNASQGSILSFTDKEDAVDEQDLFSFRTQGAVSPLKNSPAIINRDSMGSEAQSKQQSLSPKQRKSIPSLSKSKSSKKSNRKLSPNIQSRSPKRINYDGQSLIYQSTIRSKISKISAKCHNDKRELSSKALSNLFNKISKRIELSRCVVDLISHSNPTVDSEYFANRYQHELLSRNQLSNQIQSSLNNANKWRY